MANYNGGRYLGEAINSLQAQTLQSWELLFVDDRSQDDSVERAMTLARYDPRIRVVRQSTNRGPAAARNSAIMGARGRWIAIFDSDDIMQPERLMNLRERARSDNVAIVADNLLVFSDESEMTRPFIPDRIARSLRSVGLAKYIKSNTLYSRMPDLGYLKPFIRADYLARAGILYDERLRIGEDYEFMVRLLASGQKLHYEPTALYLYRKHPQSLSHRIGGDAIVALMDSDNRFARTPAAADHGVAAALRLRKKSLRVMYRYDRMLQLLKSGRYGEALAIGVRTPRSWPMLAEPLAARIARLRQRRRHASAAGLLAALEGE
jgi:succinoglycan biosynthesis protein ExoO